MRTIAITVSGKVQGVFYRQSTREKARELGLTGEVKNMEDGTVLIIATGTDQQIESLTAWCKKGPPKSVVTGVAISELPVRTFETFSIVRS